MTRRDWLYLAGQTALLAQDHSASDETQRRIAQVIHAYEEQGVHRTGTKVDQASGDWLAGEVQRAGLTPSRESFNISRIDPVTALLSAGGRRIEGVPLYDGGFTDAAGVSGKLGERERRADRPHGSRAQCYRRGSTPGSSA